MMDMLIRLSEDWLPLYAVHMLETSLFVVLVWAIDRWVSLDTRLRYSLWLCALVKAFVPPFYALPLPAFLSGSPEPIVSLPASVPPVLMSAPVDFTPIVLPPEPIPVAFWVFGLWSLSVLGFVGVTLRRNRVFQRALGIANPIQLSNELDDLTQGAKLKVFSKANLNSPLLVGVVNPRLYLPSSWQSWTPTQLRGIIAHELAHYHNRDLLVLIFQVLATVLFGLNPLTWLVNRRLAHLRELRCDEDALKKSGISPVEYGKLLYAFLDANAHPGLPALGFNEKNTPLKKRFEHVLNFKGGDMKRSKWQLIIPVLVALAIVPFSIRETYSQPQGLQSKDIDLGEFVINPPNQDGRKQISLNVILSYSDGRAKVLIENEKNKVKGAVLEALTKTPLNFWENDIRNLVESSVRINVNRLLGERTVVNAAIADLKINGQPVERNAQSNSGMRSSDVYVSVNFSPKGESHVRMELAAQIIGESESDQDKLDLNSGEIMRVLYRVARRAERDVFFEDGMIFQIRKDLQSEIQRKLNVKVKDVVLKHIKASTYTDGASDVWVNYKGDMLIDMNKAVVVNDLDAEFAKMKSDQGIQTLLLRVDRGAPQSVADAILKSATRVGLEVRPTGLATQLKTPAVPETNNKAQVLSFFQVDQQPKALNKAKPIYPAEAKAKGITGKVFLEFIVNTDGSVSNVKVLRGSEKFHQAAIDAALKLKFEPAKHQGKIVPVLMTLPISFQLGETQVQSWRPFGNSSKSNPQVSKIWVNSKGQLLLDLSETLNEDELERKLGELKQERNIHTVVIKPDDKAPVDVLKKIFEVGKQVGLRVQMKHYIPPSTERKKVEIDPDNLEFYQVGVKPKPIYHEAPIYPNIARRAGLVGKVFLKFRVNLDGSVSDVTVLRGQRIFQRPAIEALKKSKFKPAEHENRPVAVWMTQPVRFALGKGALEVSERDLDLSAFTMKIPNGSGGFGSIQPKLKLTVISQGAAEIVREDMTNVQHAAMAYLSSIPYDQWAMPEQRAETMQGIRDQINDIWGATLVKRVTLSDMLITPTKYLMEGKEFKLYSNFPNPFNPQTQIKYEIAEPVFVRMEIYNITGQVIRTLVAEDKVPGQYETRWDGRDDEGRQVASGVYYYHVNAGSFNAMKKMQLVK